MNIINLCIKYILKIDLKIVKSWTQSCSHLHRACEQSITNREEANIILNLSGAVLPVQGETIIVFSCVHIGDWIGLQRIVP